MTDYFNGDLQLDDIVFIDTEYLFDKKFAEISFRSCIVGLDAEWKPILDSSSGEYPIVSILQICHRSMCENGRATVFIIDTKSLSPSFFGKTIGPILRSKEAIKIGFGFQDDLRHLGNSFLSSEAQDCFKHVWPYVDIGRLHRKVNAHGLTYHSRKNLRCFPGGLSAVINDVLGKPLCKDLQCSNWEERPLSKSQLHYAAMDSYCLIEAFDILSQQLLEIGKGIKIPINFSAEKSTIGQNLIGKNMRDSHESSRFESICGTAALLKELSLDEESKIPTENPVSTSNQTEETTEAAAFPGMPHWMEAVKLCSEKLPLSSSMTTKKGRNAKKRGQNNTRKERNAELERMGPPPWDPSIGGDGVPRFLCDGMIEGLARHLRCVGIDAAFANNLDSRALFEKAVSEGRLLLTRDQKLLQRRLFPPNWAYRVKSLSKMEQLKDVISVFKVRVSEDRLLSRCIRCNGDFITTPLSAEEAVKSAPWSQVVSPAVLEKVSEFWQCGQCKHLYWEGHQFDRAFGHFASICTQAVDEGAVHQ